MEEGEENARSGPREESVGQADSSMWISATIGTILLLLCVFLIAQDIQERRHQARFNHAVSRQISDVRQLILACRTYAADNSDVLPRDLQDLVDEGYMDMPELLVTRHTVSGLPEPYLYRPGKLGTDPPRTILIVAPESPKSGLRTVGYVGGNVAEVRISNDEVAELLAEAPEEEK